MEVFLKYLNEWEEEIDKLPGKKGEKQRMCLSKETRLGLRITGSKYQSHALLCFVDTMSCIYLSAVNSFTELGPKLLALPGVSYLLSEVFSQDLLERYFSRQRH